MIRLFRRTRPAPQHRLDPHEAKVIAAHKHTEASWHALTDHERADLRATYTQAERYAA